MAWADSRGAGLGRGDGFNTNAGQRTSRLTVHVRGQVLLRTGNLIGGLVGGPPLPEFVRFTASLRVYSRPDKQLIETFATDAQGRFDLRLRPGAYRIVPDIMQGNRTIAPGDTQDLIIIGFHQEAPGLDFSLKLNRSQTVTVVYESVMGN